MPPAEEPGSARGRAAGRALLSLLGRHRARLPPPEGRMEPRRGRGLAYLAQGVFGHGLEGVRQGKERVDRPLLERLGGLLLPGVCPNSSRTHRRRCWGKDPEAPSAPGLEVCDVRRSGSAWWAECLGWSRHEGGTRKARSPAEHLVVLYLTCRRGGLELRRSPDCGPLSPRILRAVDRRAQLRPP